MYRLSLAGTKECDELVIILFLHLQHKFRGYFWPYLSCFPDTYPQSPFYFSAEDFELFEETPIFYRAMGQREALKETYQALAERTLLADQQQQVKFLSLLADVLVLRRGLHVGTLSVGVHERRVTCVYDYDRRSRGAGDGTCG